LYLTISLLTKFYELQLIILLMTEKYLNCS
jgi:hypothetical protein